MKRETIVDIITYLFALLFSYTGAMKLIDQFRFWSALAKSHLLWRLAPELEWVVPISELLITVSLLIPRTRRIGLYASLITMSIFTVYVGYTVFFLHGQARPCTCGGVISAMNWPQHLLFNIVFTTLAAIGLRLERKLSTMPSKPSSNVKYQFS